MQLATVVYICSACKSRAELTPCLRRPGAGRGPGVKLGRRPGTYAIITQKLATVYIKLSVHAWTIETDRSVHLPAIWNLCLAAVVFYISVFFSLLPSSRIYKSVRPITLCHKNSFLLINILTCNFFARSICPWGGHRWWTVCYITTHLTQLHLQNWNANITVGRSMSANTGRLPSSSLDSSLIDTHKV